MIDFDLQLFDEEVSENPTETTSENSSAEPQQAELPEGFEGLEEFKDEILQDIAEMSKAEETDGEKISETQNETSQPQYKTADEEITALKARIDELQKQGGQVQQQQTPPPVQRPPQVQQRPQPVQVPPMQITPEFMTHYNRAVDTLTMQMTGMTEQDVKDLQYATEDDDDFKRWKAAREFAARQVQADIQKTRQAQITQAQQFQNMQMSAANDFQNFTAREMKEPDFKSVQDFAVNTLFQALPVNAQQTLAISYNKILNGTASSAEMMLIQNYFAQAKAIFRSQKNQPKNNQSARNAAGKLPKVDSLNDANASNYNGLSYSDLEKIIDSTDDFDKLDPKIKKMFEG